MRFRTALSLATLFYCMLHGSFMGYAGSRPACAREVGSVPRQQPVAIGENRLDR
jgi:hypothetical protein